MSLVGTRPPTVDEWEQYELHHRSRMSTKPGILLPDLRKDMTESNLRVLVIHSGGDSKRVPQYSALGKLFSPVPHALPNGRNSTLFDEFMICMSSVPSRIREGMVLLSGDVLLLFNPLQIDYNNVGAAAISFKEHVETGKNHGVYLNGENGNVKCCLQKKSVEVLREVGAVNESDCVDIDTGALIFSTEMMKSLYSLIATEEDYDRHVNENSSEWTEAGRSHTGKNFRKEDCF